MTRGSAVAMHGSVVASHGPAVAMYGSVVALCDSVVATRGSAVAMHGSVVASHGSVVATHGPVVATHGRRFQRCSRRLCLQPADGGEACDVDEPSEPEAAAHEAADRGAREARPAAARCVSQPQHFSSDRVLTLQKRFL